MNTNHWRKALKKNPDILKQLPKFVEGKRNPVSMPMKPSTVEKLKVLKAKLGYKG